jgi:capsule biosynthesis phosphatase
MNIFLLCAGKGSRFESILPKPLNLINGKPMIFHTITSLQLHRVPRYHLYVVYNRKLEQCNFEEILINMFPDIHFSFILLDYFTRGASESAYMGLQTALLKHAAAGSAQGMDPAARYDSEAHLALQKGNVLFLDNDTLYPSDMWQHLAMDHTTSFIFSNFNNEKEPLYSYLKVNEDNFVEDIKEKQKISDLICVGGYGFKDKDEFLSTFQYILETNSKTNNEFYMSLMFEVLLGKYTSDTPASPVYPGGALSLKDVEPAPVAVSVVRNITINKTVSMGTPQQLMDEGRVRSHLRYVFDLDNTLVTYPSVHKDYSSVRPIPKMIQLAQKLKADGHTIIIYTARRMATHHNNVGAVIKDIGRITMDTLERFAIPYDELIFGKPLGDIYIDDRAYNPYDERLYHLLGEYQMIDDDIDNKLANNKYNTIKCVNERIIKSVDKVIGAGELFFYESLQHVNVLRSHECRQYFVKYFGYTVTDHHIDLKLEKINGIPLAYLYINQTFSLKLLRKLLSIVHKLHSIHLHDREAQPLALEQFALNYTAKLKARFQVSAHYSFRSAQTIYDAIQQRMQAYVESPSFASNIVSVIHGDCWFSNILLTYRDEFKLIDMKGLVNGVQSLGGDKLYDYAKILQSLAGFDAILYDKEMDAAYRRSFIVFFQAWLEENDPSVRFEHVQTVTACLVFGVFHAYADMGAEKKGRIVQLVQDLLWPREADLSTTTSSLSSSPISSSGASPRGCASTESTSPELSSWASPNSENFQLSMHRMHPIPPQFILR